MSKSGVWDGGNLITSFTDCPSCLGTGRGSFEPCFQCGGSGMVEDDEDDIDWEYIDESDDDDCF